MSSILKKETNFIHQAFSNDIVTSSFHSKKKKPPPLCFLCTPSASVFKATWRVSAEAIAESLEVNETLRKINFMGNVIGAEGAEAVSLHKIRRWDFPSNSLVLLTVLAIFDLFWAGDLFLGLATPRLNPRGAAKGAADQSKSEGDGAVS